ncbi:NAD-dependent epimerase/dehydratase family protein [Glutamicibacter arilaitensis]|uniref:NAD-dependent epimerase/dehydratase family protein n=1 Tax=Glutamicibacter arilaitensis TaxID=256701 RepID=UPI0038515670
MASTTAVLGNMKLLVLGGTVFLSQYVAQFALDAGHLVTCAARGESGIAPQGSEFIYWDRNDPAPAELATLQFDAVIDVSRTPAHVRRATQELSADHWVFVSTISVYSDLSLPGGSPTNAKLFEPLESDGGQTTAETYGAMKVACEQLVHEHQATAAIIRPGLLVGPKDPTGRFSYWPEHAARSLDDGFDLLVPLAAEDPVQVLDARDLAIWLIELAEEKSSGTFDAVGPATSRRQFIAQIFQALEGEPRVHWADAASLHDQGVVPWSGERSLPLWLPDPAVAGMLDRDHRPVQQAGLRARSLAQTTVDTLQWLHGIDGARTGLSREEEVTILSNLATVSQGTNR